MFYGVVKGRKRRFIGGEHDGRRLLEIWQGDKKLWPSDDLAYRIRVKLPETGSLDWIYWVHAVDSVTRGKCTSQNYLRFEIDGLLYYLQQSPDGTLPYVLDGDVLELRMTSDGVPADLLGGSLKVDAVIPKRRYTIHPGGVQNSAISGSSELPLLDGTVVGYRQACWRRKRGSTSDIRVYSMFSDTLKLKNTLYKQSRTWQEYSWQINGIVPGDTRWRYNIWISGQGGLNNVFAQYPAFKRTFNLKIISIE